MVFCKTGDQKRYYNGEGFCWFAQHRRHLYGEGPDRGAGERLPLAKNKFFRRKVESEESWRQTLMEKLILVIING